MTDIVSVIKKRISEIDAELADHPLKRERETLERTLNDLTKSPSGKAKPTRARRRRSSSKRAPRGERRRQVIDHLSAHPQARPSEIAKAIGASPNQVHGILAKLGKEKLVTKTAKGYKLTKSATAT